MAIITIAHQIGSGGREIGQAVAKRLQLPYIDREIVQGIARKLEISEELASSMDEKARGLMEQIFLNLNYTSAMVYAYSEDILPPIDEAVYQEAARAVIEASADSNKAVIAGHGANFALAEHNNILSVYIYAPAERRMATLMGRENLTKEAAAKMLTQNDNDRAHYIKTHYNTSWTDPAYYHLMINTGAIKPEMAAELIVQAAQASALDPLKPAKPRKGQPLLTPAPIALMTTPIFAAF